MHEAQINMRRCEGCKWYAQSEEEEIVLPESEYFSNGKEYKTLASEKKENKILSKSDIEEQLKQFRSPVSKGGGTHGKRKNKYNKKEDHYRCL